MPITFLWLSNTYIGYKHIDTVIIIFIIFFSKKKEENSNKNTVLASTQRDYIAGEVSKDLTKRILLPEKISEAHENGLLYFHNADYFIFSIDNKSKTLRPFTPEKETLVTENWKHLNKQNICKANFICKDVNELPSSKDDVNQTSVFENQLTKYVEKDETVSILNSFPLFLYEYFKEIF